LKLTVKILTRFLTFVKKTQITLIGEVNMSVLNTWYFNLLSIVTGITK